MIKRIENLIILFLGFCLGALVGILSAPTKGSIARDGLIYRLKSSKKKLHSFITKLIGHKNELTNEAKNNGKEVITDVVSSAQAILKELELIANELKEKKE